LSDAERLLFSWFCPEHWQLQTLTEQYWIVSDLRKRVKVRLLAEPGMELEQAAIARETMDKYWETRDKQYKEFKQKIS
jgi:hypothetical protein